MEGKTSKKEGRGGDGCSAMRWTRRANEEKHVLQGASAKFDVGSDKIWSTLDFGISEKFDHLPPGGQSPLEVYIVLSLNV